jgi:hypothetical protein
MFFAVISAQGVLSPSIGKHRRADAVEVMATDNLPDLVDSLAFNPRGIPFHIMLLLRMASGGHEVEWSPPGINRQGIIAEFDRSSKWAIR